MRKRICAGNWKMFKTAAEAVDYVERFAHLAPSVPQSVELVICPPFTALPAISQALRGNDRIKLGAQNMHWDARGPYTGEISAPMLLEFGVQYVILGHSERRLYFGETDAYVRLKAETALQNGLIPIVAVGESLDVRQAGDAKKFVLAQVRAALDGLSNDALAKIVIAYEPIWAIGTGENCDPHDANEIMRAIRGCIPALRDVPVLYGGSVKPDNIALYMAQSDIDGALVGGASLDPDGFAELARQA